MKLRFDFWSKCGVLMVALLATASFSFAQRTVTGTITDAASGEPLIGANILVVGSTTGTVTDFDGNYELQVPESATTIKITYTGYADQEVDITSGTEFNIEMAEGTQLEEVVVTGYGTTKSKEVTSAITSVKAEDFNQGNLNSPGQLLQGKVAGLVISRPGSDPNGGINIRLRGLGSLGANTSPLVIIDGVLGADINSVDPNDIASIDVLKDASASAIYGTRGAAGVIIITTKTGVGAPQIDYNGFVTAETVENTVDVLTTDEFRNFRGGSNGQFQGNDLGNNTDWFDEITQVGVTQVHSLSLSGGSKGTSYRVSGNIRDVNGIALNTGFFQANGRINLQQKALNDRLTVNANLNVTTRDGEFGDPSAFRYATIYNPTAPVRDPAFDDTNDGFFEQNLFDYRNPVAILEQNPNEFENRNTIVSLRGTYTLLPGLDIGAFYSQERNDFQNRRYADKNSLGQGADRNGFASQRNDKRLSELFEATVNYETTIAGAEMDFTGGYSYQDFTNSGFGAEGGNIISDAFTFNNFGAAQDFNNGLGSVFSYKNTSVLTGFFGRVQFNVDDTYFLTASVRHEGSSQFGANNKWGTFPAVSGGVNLANVLDLPNVDNLKFRAGYGQTGQLPPNPYISLQRFGETGSSFFFDGAFVPSYGPASNPNPDLKWEVKEEVNIGVDFAFNDFMFVGSVDYFNTITNDLIFEIGVPVPPNQFPNTFLNIGEIQNSGLEATLEIAAISNEDFTWKTAINGTYFIQSELRNFLDGADGFRDLANLGSPGQNGTPLVRVQEGQPIGQLWGLVYEGIDDDGNWIFADTNGDGNPGQNDDRAVIGQGLPDFQLGWNNTFNFGNFDLNFFFRGVFGHDLVNTFRALYEAPQSIGSYNQPATVTDVQGLNAGPQFSSFHVEDADFVRLDNANLGYTFDLPEGGNFRKIRVYLTGNNLFTITGYNGVDPEIRLTDGDNALAPGIDRRNTFFTSRSVGFGVQVGL